ncbi:MAG: hypothetical protein LBU04_04805 [Christensenellaceae bacterium]|jgi:xanthine/uracil permease|nr:hypothetical protein [Christensenellaceae bacterium]
MNKLFILASSLQYDDGTLENFKLKLTNLLKEFAPYIIGVVSAFVLLWAIFIGIKWWQAGNQDKQREAKEYLKNFIIGIILIFVIGAGAVALISFLGNWMQA